MEAFFLFIYLITEVVFTKLYLGFLLFHGRRKIGALTIIESEVKCLLKQIMKGSLWQKVKMVTFDKQQISSPNLL